uniref:hypothetical protein n=1 Tax=Lachnospira eligens TaxID=39485 RepID=UPI00402767BA
MKRIGAFSLAIFIFVLSVFSVVPVNVRADDDKTVIPLVEGHFGLTESDAQSKVSAHKDIYYDNNQRAFAYTPASSYNWTLCNSHGATTSTHLSDKQVVALLCSSNRWEHNRTLISSFVSNNNIFRGFMSGVGSLFTGDSDNGTKFLDIVTGNYNYLDSLDYDEDSQTITMSNDNGSVDKLREEIKKYYYELIGLNEWKASGTVKEWVDSPTFRKSFDYEEDYNNGYGYSQYNYVICSGQYFSYFFNEADLFYISNDERINLTVDNWSVLFYKVYFYNKGSSTSSFIPADKAGLITHYQYTYHDVTECALYRSNSYGFAIYPSPATWSSETSKESSRNILLYSKDKKPLKYFSSYGALYNYMNGDQNAYLSSTIEKTGEDITFSIKDMNENLGNKMDTLIDSINSNKSNMSADELQNAIDKGLEDLNKNTEDIKDNTSSILDKLEEQNQILLQILGVTEFIAYQEVKENSDQYNMSYLKTLLDSMFIGLFNALMYGENTVDDKNTDTAYIQSFSVSNAAAPVAVYSDDIAVYDSSGSGGGSSFGGGSDSSGGHFFDLKNGLFGKFPFSIPYQCYNWLQILQRDPEAPTFTLDYGYLFGCSGDPKFILSFDLSRYNDIAEVGRSFCRLFMTLMLALGIYHKNKGEM